MVRRVSLELERSVSTPGIERPRAASPVVPGSIDTDNQRTWETAKCRAAVGGGRSSDDDRDNITRSERRASSQVCEVTSDDRGIASIAINPPAFGGAVYEL
jgi:hypothetical protein